MLDEVVKGCLGFLIIKSFLGIQLSCFSSSDIDD
jgi:hypothetical protein